MMSISLLPGAVPPSDASQLFPGGPIRVCPGVFFRIHEGASVCSPHVVRHRARAMLAERAGRSGMRDNRPCSVADPQLAVVPKQTDDGFPARLRDPLPALGLICMTPSLPTCHAIPSNA